MGVIAQILKIIEGMRIKPLEQKTFKQILAEELKKQDGGHIDKRV